MCSVLGGSHLAARCAIPKVSGKILGFILQQTARVHLLIPWSLDFLHKFWHSVLWTAWEQSFTENNLHLLVFRETITPSPCSLLQLNVCPLCHQGLSRIQALLFQAFSAEQVRSWFFRVVAWRRLVCYRRLVPIFKVQDVQDHLLSHVDPWWIVLGQLYLKKWFHKFSRNVGSKRTHSRNSPERRRRKILNLIYATYNCHPTESTVPSMNILPCNYVIRISCSQMSSQTNSKVTVLYSIMISKSINEQLFDIHSFSLLNIKS